MVDGWLVVAFFWPCLVAGQLTIRHQLLKLKKTAVKEFTI